MTPMIASIFLSFDAVADQLRPVLLLLSFLQTACSAACTLCIKDLPGALWDTLSILLGLNLKF